MTTTPADLFIGLADGTFYGGDPFPAFAWIAPGGARLLRRVLRRVGDHPVRRREGDLEGPRDVLERRGALGPTGTRCR